MGQACCRSQSPVGDDELSGHGFPKYQAGSSEPGTTQVDDAQQLRQVSEADILASLASKAMDDSPELSTSSSQSGEDDDEFLSARSEFSIRTQSWSDLGEGDSRAGSMTSQRPAHHQPSLSKKSSLRSAKVRAAARLKEYLALDPEGLLSPNNGSLAPHLRAPAFPVEEEGWRERPVDDIVSRVAKDSNDPTLASPQRQELAVSDAGDGHDQDLVKALCKATEEHRSLAAGALLKQLDASSLKKQSKDDAPGADQGANEEIDGYRHRSSSSANGSCHVITAEARNAVLEAESEVLGALAALRDPDKETEQDHHLRWHHSRYGDVLDIAHLAIPGTSRHRVRFEVELPHPMEHLVALMHEWDLLSSWNTTCHDTIVLESPSLWEGTVYTAQWMPFPFPDGQVLVRAKGHDLADERHSLMVTFVSVPYPDDKDTSRKYPTWNRALPEAIKDRKNLEVLPTSCLMLRALPRGPDGKPRSKSEIHVDVDVHFKYVPNALINFVLKVLAPFIYNTAIKVLDAHFGSPEPSLWEERIAAQPELFERLKDRLEEVDRMHAEETG